MIYGIDRDILAFAIHRYGEQSQIVMLFEEMAELQKEVCKNMRGNENLEHLEEELADVYIMMEQLRIMLSLNEINIQAYIDKKITRLSERIGYQSNER